jgi:hypothetical protein
VLRRFYPFRLPAARFQPSFLHGISERDEPQERWLSLLAAGVLPGTGRGSAFRLHKESGPGGFAIETGNGGQQRDVCPTNV